jgi:hypothetical protein
MTADVLSGVVAVVVLLLAVVFGLLLGIELVTAALGDAHRYWSLVPMPESSGARAALLCALAAFFAFAMVLVSRSREACLTLAAEGGVVLLPHEAVVELVEQEFATHPDVVRARAEVRPCAEGLSADLRVFLRPGADQAGLEPLIREAGVAGVRGAVGVAPEIGRFKLRVLKVDELARYL